MCLSLVAVSVVGIVYRVGGATSCMKEEEAVNLVYQQGLPWLKRLATKSEIDQSTWEGLNRIAVAANYPRPVEKADFRRYITGLILHLQEKIQIYVIVHELKRSQ